MELNLISHSGVRQQPRPLNQDAQLIAALLFIVLYLPLDTAELLLLGMRPGQRVGMNNF